MLTTQNFLPQESIVEGESFCDYEGNQFNVVETRLQNYVQSLQSLLKGSQIEFTEEEYRSIITAGALIDSLTKTRLDGENPDFPMLESGHHAFNIFYKAPNSNEWNLQFANAPYAEKLGTDFSEILQISEKELMQKAYKAETIERFSTLAKNSKGGYTAQFIEMDNIPVDSTDAIPAFFWYRKEFNHPDGGKIQVRIGMNGTGLLEKQKIELTELYKLANVLREEHMEHVHYSRPSYEALVTEIKDRLSCILGVDTESKKETTMTLGWMQMVLEIADDIIKNSPLPLTIVDRDGVIEHVSPAYAAMVGYTVNDILKPGFFDRIYPGIEGSMVKQSIQFYKENGHYPKGASFVVSRGKTFRPLEERKGIHTAKSIELIPSPYLFDEGTVRLNTARPLEPIDGLDDVPLTDIHFGNETLETPEDVGTDSQIHAYNNWLKDNS